MRHSAEFSFFLPAQEGERPPVDFGSGGAPAGGEASTGAAQGGEAGDGTTEAPSTNSFWIMLALLFVFMWFFVIRPESKRRKQTQEFQAGLAKGDDVVTAGGLHGVIAALDETTVTLKVGDSVRLKFDRNAVGRRASAPAEEQPPAKK